jgi:hypothetical protein
MTQAETADLRCKQCGQPVELTGGDGLPDEFREALHAVTGSEAGPDGHLAAPIAVATAIDPFTSKEWRVLLPRWDEAYDFAHDPSEPEPFSATRRDKLATVLRAPAPEALRKLVTEDHGACPVPPCHTGVKQDEPVNISAISSCRARIGSTRRDDVDR